MVDDKEEPEVEETHFDRRKKYKAFVAGGMSDKQASETVWPTSAATMTKNAKDKKEKDAKEGKEKKGKE
ncbi:MAG: hypothetical protein NTV88_01620 [Candidatus Micrarchaeota archaeon]|nr:hypothetical protein [Candidatus Micrarchaeota archaeon]